MRYEKSSGPGRAAIQITGEWLDPSARFAAVGGSLDLDGAAQLKRALTDFREQGANRFVLDLSRVRFVDSTGLSVLIGLHRQLRGKGILVITAPSRAVTKLLELTGVARALNVFATWEDATAFVGALRYPTFLRPASGAGTAAAVVSMREMDQDWRETETYAEPAPAIPFSDDATVALGIATTAMAFARSPESQVERWLRILLRQGDAGAILSSLGISDEPTPATGEPGSGSARGLITDSGSYAVAAVTRSACVLAERRGAPLVFSSDLLEAVKQFYGPTFELVLARHAADETGLQGRLEDLLSGCR